MRDFDELFRAMPQEDQEEVLREAARSLPPGSSAALGLGCTCPVYDNAHGAGMGRDEHGRVVYVMSEGCPLHGGRGGEVRVKPFRIPSGVLPVSYRQTERNILQYPVWALVLHVKYA